MRGIGIQPAGTTSAGFGDPAEADADESVLLADALTGASRGSRKIDPLTRDYVLDGETGRLLGMDDMQQLVQIAIANAAPALREIDKLTVGFEQQMTAILTAACSGLVDQGLIQVLGVSTRMNEEGGLKAGQAVTVFRWFDRTTNEEQENRV